MKKLFLLTLLTIFTGLGNVYAEETPSGADLCNEDRNPGEETQVPAASGQETNGSSATEVDG
ncbi:MAG: hypothetical protein QF441_12180 [Bacteriovoracaceae bacterium]|jgi:hypothetical protein|nr:hypothetical protein [Halobacteriovoraceae bacterium]MDP7321363.1 hypothetical protein [Bacteriovoracaceae bacterium]|tara:strand:+ start:225 stop:410 length:186 start_codon:yes stop_codon:yes gene_type:complete